jgi:type VI secretion system protein ImpL
MLGDPGHMDSNLATTVLTSAWHRQSGLPEAMLSGMVKFYVSTSHHATWVIKPDLVQLSRQQLYSPINSNNLYAELRSNGIDQLGLISAQSLILGNAGNTSNIGSAWLVSDSDKRLPKLFTQWGWQSYAKPEIDKLVKDTAQGDWVMGDFHSAYSPNDSRILQAQLQQLYFTDYFHAWMQFLQSIQLQPFDSLDTATKQLNMLAKPQGPLGELLLVVYANLGFININSVVRDKMHDALPLLTPGKNHMTSNDVANYLQSFTAMTNQLGQMTISPDPGRDAQNTVFELLSDNNTHAELYQAALTVDSLTANIADPEIKQAMQSVLLMPVRATWRLILQLATAGLQQQWQTQVLSVYQQTLANKFPFAHVAHGQDDAQLADVTHFFQPSTGLLWQFVNQHVMPYLQQTSSGLDWQPRTWLNMGPDFSPAFLRSLAQAKALSDGLFVNGGNNPELILSIYPEPTPGLREIMLTTNGQIFRYRNDPQEWQKINWPGELSVGDVSDAPDASDTSLEIISAQNTDQGEIEFDGLWGLFALLQSAELMPDKDNALRATWKMHTDKGQRYQVNLLIKTDEDNIVLTDFLLQPFQLPAKMFDEDE